MLQFKNLVLVFSKIGAFGKKKYYSNGCLFIDLLKVAY